jgi:hypothetical protein
MLHPSIAIARASLLNCALLGAWNIWLVLTQPGLLASGAALLGLVVLSQAGRRWTGRVAESNDRVEPIAWIPVVCVAVALVGYGLALTAVNIDYFSHRSNALIPRLNSAAGEESAATAMVNREVSALIARETHNAQSPARTARETVELSQLSRIEHQSGNEPSRLALEVEQSRFPQHGLSTALAHQLVTENNVKHIERLRPNSAELPPWFGKLGGFFTVATQLLAALVAVLAFGHWREGVSEALYRTAMPIAAVGVAAGLAGNLPALSRALQAIFLAPVFAGLAGAVGALVVASMGSGASPDPSGGT